MGAIQSWNSHPFYLFCFRAPTFLFRSFCNVYMASKTIADISSCEASLKGSIAIIKWLYLIFLCGVRCAEKRAVRKRDPAVIRVKGTPRTVVIRKVRQHVPDVGRLLALTHNVPTAGTTRTCLSICKEQRERGWWWVSTDADIVKQLKWDWLCYHKSDR